MEQKMVRNVNNTEKIFAQRMEKHQDELRWLYMELYGNDAMYAELCEQMHDYYLKRSTELKKRDIKKEKNPDWFKEKEMLGRFSESKTRSRYNERSCQIDRKMS